MPTHPQLLPEGDHSSVGGHGILGSASSSLVGVSTLGYPSGLADPLDSSRASEGQIAVESAITTATSTTTSATSSSNSGVTSRQPPTVAAEVTAAALSSPTLDAQVVEMPTRNRRRSSSVTLSPPTLSPAPHPEQSPSVLHRIGRAASLQRAASSQRRSQRPPSLSPTQWTGSYGSPSPPIGSDIEAEYPAARPAVYQPRLIEAGQAPLQVDLRPRAFPGVSLAAEVQPHVAHTPSDIVSRGEAGHVLSKVLTSRVRRRRTSRPRTIRPRMRLCLLV